MHNINWFLGQSAETTVAIIVGVVAFVLLGFSLYLLWKLDLQINGSSKNINYQKEEHGKGVKTVYSDKTLDYSGTEYLPIPTKAPTKQYVYEFAGWDKNAVDKNGNPAVKPIFLQKVRTCRICVYNDDKTTLLKSFNVDYGSGISLDDIKPEKKDTKEFSYKFVGWDKDATEFFKDEKIYAIYEATPKKYTYKFFDEDRQTLFYEATAIFGTPIIVPKDPIKQGTENGDYQFVGWENLTPGAVLMCDINFFAKYKLVPKQSLEDKLEQKQEEKNIQEKTQKIEENSEKIAKENTQQETNLNTNSVVIPANHGGFIQLNNKNIVGEPDKKMSAEVVVVNQKEVPKTSNESQKVIKVKLQKDDFDTNSLFENMVVNKRKITSKKDK